MQIEVEPVSFLGLNVPAQVVSATLRWCKLGGEAIIMWNTLVREIEPAIRERCRAALQAVQLCLEKQHLLCRACGNCAGCGRSICRRPPGRCRECGERWPQA